MLDNRARNYQQAGEPRQAEHRRLDQSNAETDQDPRTNKLDTRLLTITDVDQRISEWVTAEREHLHELLVHMLAEMPTEGGERGPPGFLPIVKAWRREDVYYAGDVVAFDGSTWQATKDTAQAPGSGGDWQLLARGGSDAFRPQVRGTYGAEKSTVALI